MLKLPFGTLPGHWGLAGKSREIAKAEYELEDFDRYLKILEIRKDEYRPEEYEEKILDLNFFWKRITKEEYDRALAELIVDVDQKALVTLELDRVYGKISGLAYDKALATAKKEPWINVVKMDFTQKSSLEGSFELDWNEYFVDKLNTEGYVGATPDNIVNQWFMELCRNVAMEEFDGTGNFTSDSEANLDAVKRWGAESKHIGGGRKGYS
jgi:hypothetical protein